jgi:hypothetical protein
MPIPYSLDYVIERSVSERYREQRAIRKLTGVRVSLEEARAVWPRILDHKWFISEKLGRDTGLRVAAIDFFENIYSQPTAYRSRDTLPRQLRAMQPLRVAA